MYKCNISQLRKLYLGTVASIVSANLICAHKFTRHVMHRARALSNMYGLLTKCEVKMAWYWPSSFFARPISSHLDRVNLINKGFIIWSLGNEKLYFCKNAQTTLTCSVVTLACLVAAASVISTTWTSTIPYSSLSWKLAPVFGVEQVRAV